MLRPMSTRIMAGEGATGDDDGATGGDEVMEA